MHDTHQQDAVPPRSSRSEGRPYTWERIGKVGHSDRFRIITPDGQRAYMVSLGRGFECCNCQGFRQYGRCRHVPAMRRALEHEPFASQGTLDISWGSYPPAGRRRPDLPDEETITLRHACETALNTLIRLRITDMQWHHHGDLLQEIDNELIPLLRNAIHHSRSSA